MTVTYYMTVTSFARQCHQATVENPEWAEAYTGPEGYVKSPVQAKRDFEPSHGAVNHSVLVVG